MFILNFNSKVVEKPALGSCSTLVNFTLTLHIVLSHYFTFFPIAFFAWRIAPPGANGTLRDRRLPRPPAPDQALRGGHPGAGSCASCGGRGARGAGGRAATNSAEITFTTPFKKIFFYDFIYKSL